MTSPLKILHLEDDPLDAQFIKTTLEEEDIACDILRVKTRDDFIEAISEQYFDILFADYLLPGFDGLSALAIAKEKCPSTPFIFISGNMGEDLAIETLKSGATDYVLKNRIARLGPSVRRALQEATERAERQKAVTDLKKSHEQLHRLTAHLQSVREEERTNIAREIHDELGQTLTAIKIDLAYTTSKLSANSGNKQLIEKLLGDADLINTAIQTVKKICSSLRPPILDHFGLEAAVKWQIDEFQKRTTIHCVRIIDLENVVIADHLATAIFRILQEALTNIMRHSEATIVQVFLKKQNGNILLKVHDNGKGIIMESQSTRSGSFGIIGMQERVRSFGGEFTVSGTSADGTTVMVSIPHDIAPETTHITMSPA